MQGMHFLDNGTALTPNSRFPTPSRQAREMFLRASTVLNPDDWNEPRLDILRLEPADWEAVNGLAVGHGLIGMVARSLEWAQQRAGLPVPILDRLAAARRGQLIQLMRRRSAARVVGETLAARNIEFVIYKGPVLSEEVYGDLSLRSFRDCDVLVPAEQFQAAHDTLRDLGYALSDHERLDDFIRPVRYAAGVAYSASMRHPDGFVVDLHWSISGQELLPRDPAIVWRYCRPPEGVGRLPGLRMSPALTLINSATHLYAHGYHGLKPLVDFYVTAVNWGSRIDLDELYSTARALDMQAMLALAARLCGRMFAPHPLILRIAPGPAPMRTRFVFAVSERRLMQTERVGDFERRVRRLAYCGTLSSSAKGTRIFAVPSPGELELRFRQRFSVSLYARYYLLQIYRIFARSDKPFSAFLVPRARQPFAADGREKDNGPKRSLPR